MIEYLVCECAHLVETCERTSSRDSGSNLCKGLCFDLLVDEATFGGSGVECGHKTLQVGDAIGVLTTTSAVVLMDSMAEEVKALIMIIKKRLNVDVF